MLVRRRDGRRGCVTHFLPGGPTGTGTRVRVPGYCVPEVDLIRRPSLNTRGTIKHACLRIFITTGSIAVSSY